MWLILGQFWPLIHLITFYNWLKYYCASLSISCCCVLQSSIDSNKGCKYISDNYINFICNSELYSNVINLYALSGFYHTSSWYWYITFVNTFFDNLDSWLWKNSEIFIELNQLFIPKLDKCFSEGRKHSDIRSY